MQIPLHDKYNQVVDWARIDPQDHQIGRLRWYVHTTGHAVRKGRVQGRGRWRNVYMHRELMGLTADDVRQVDHINGDRLDNRRTNLRIVTNAQNAQNRHGYKNNTSGYRGVTWQKAARKWQAQFMLNGQLHYLGLFEDLDEAAAVVAKARLEAMPFAR